jgi:regulator of protease activity HflC (stomatin/prohibitin superfamily)
LKTIKLLLILCLGIISCSKVPTGHVGVKVYLLGGSKGIDHEVLGPGRYFVGWNEELYLFPTFKQTDTWVKSNEKDESITFQTQEGLSVNADVGITYSIAPDNVAKVFTSYRRGVDEITDTFLRNMVRDAFNSVSSTMPVEAVYGSGKEDLVKKVESRVIAEVKAIGIDIENVYLVGSLRFSEQVTKAISSKIEATQKAIMRENELREAEAEAKKHVAAAEGEANSQLVRAKASAESALIEAEAEAKSNQVVGRSITRELIDYHRVQKWDGKLPQYAGGNALIELKP